MWVEVRVQTESFDLGEEEKRLRAHAGDCGAVVAFMGLVREFNFTNSPEPAVTSLFLEHYPQVTENEITRIVHEAGERWSLQAAQVIHRVGQLHTHEPIVLVIVVSSHRAEAFVACEFIIDYLKTQAPFWKREHQDDGQTKWVDAKTSDQIAQDRWTK